MTSYAAVVVAMTCAATMNGAGSSGALAAIRDPAFDIPLEPGDGARTDPARLRELAAFFEAPNRRSAEARPINDRGSPEKAIRRCHGGVLRRRGPHRSRPSDRFDASSTFSAEHKRRRTVALRPLLSRSATASIRFISRPGTLTPRYSGIHIQISSLEPKKGRVKSSRAEPTAQFSTASRAHRRMSRSCFRAVPCVGSTGYRLGAGSRSRRRDSLELQLIRIRCQLL